MSTESSPSRCAELRPPRKAWLLNEGLRAELSKPFGRLISTSELKNNIKECTMLMTVGDMVSLTLLENGFRPKLVIFDLKTERRSFTSLGPKLGSTRGENVKVKNPAGQITAELVNEIGKAMKRDVPTNIQVDGEEDLAALACAAMAPIGSCLIYGIPGKGMELVRIDQERAGRAKALIYSMEELN